MAPLALRYAALSHVGLVRSDNEDSGFAGSRLLLVADGMGGHAAGELASSIATAEFAKLDPSAPSEADFMQQLEDAVEETQDHLARVIAHDPNSAGMGTTLTAMAWDAGSSALGLVHIGDSRAYVLEGGVLSQMTRDDTYVQALVEAGKITAEEATTHPKRNLLLKALDGRTQVESTPSIRKVSAGQRYLLCTDGLCGYVSDEEIRSILVDAHDPTLAVQLLVDKALDKGAPDNVTCVVADVYEVEPTAPPSTGAPIAVGAVSEPRNRARLPGLEFPADIQRSDEPQPAPATGPPASGESAPPRSRAPRRRWPLVAAALALGAVALLGVSWVYIQSNYYVGQDNGTVAIYRGLPGGPHSLVETSEVQTAQLPNYQRSQVEENIQVGDLGQAQAIVDELRKAAEQCKQRPIPEGCPR